MGVYINNGLYLQMYGFLRNTQAIYQIILLLSDKTHLSRAEKIRADSLLQESALLYSSELICEICVRIDCRWVVVCIFGVDLWVGWGCTTLGVRGCRCGADYKSGSRRPGSGRRGWI